MLPESPHPLISEGWNAFCQALNNGRGHCFYECAVARELLPRIKPFGRAGAEELEWFIDPAKFDHIVP